MTIADIAVVIGALIATAGLVRFFFGARESRRAELSLLGTESRSWW